MSLPTDPKQPWPPASVPMADLAVWGEWYAGRFSAAGGSLSRLPLTTGSFPERMTGGFVHRHDNLRSSSATAARSSAQSLHCPLACDIAQVSADLLFGEMPDVRFVEKGDAKTQERLDELLDAMGAQNSLLEAAEPCAALGGCYLRIVWDRSLVEHPLITHVDADKAVPEFRLGTLTAVTFWREVTGEAGKEVVLRHLERYEPGVILHGLYRGSRSTLGHPVSLQMSPDTEDLEPEIILPEGLPHGMAAFYVPNVRPNPAARGSYLGRADIGGAEGGLDALDEVWSGLMRDVRLGQSRILVPSGTLTPGEAANPRGSGRSFDLDREVFTEIDVPPESLPPTVVQPDIRVEKHLAAAVALTRDIITKAGYSPQTFGLEIHGQAESGTALRIREGRTHHTLGRKRRYWESALQDACQALLLIDRTEFGGMADPLRPQIVWPEEGMGLGEMATTVQALRGAEATSIETRVRLINPDWDDEQVSAEVERVSSESGALVAEPAF